MPTSLNINTVFKGHVAGDIIREIFLEASTISNDLIDMVLNVKGKKAYLRVVTLEGGLVDYTCKFEPAGDVGFGEKEVTLKKLRMPIELCKEEFRDTWEQLEMSASANNANTSIPQTPLEALLDSMRGTALETIELDIWQGDYKTKGHFGGILVELIKDTKAAGRILVEKDPITVTNVEDIFEKVILSTPIKVTQRADFRLVTDAKTNFKYRRALSNAK